MFLRSSARFAACASIMVLSGIGAAPAASAHEEGEVTAHSTMSERVASTVQAMWAHADADWKDRLEQDETQQLCSRFRNDPPDDVALKIRTKEAATIVFPKDGQLLGDWREGEKVAQNGRGGQFSDAADTPRGGNCYACHEMAKTELSFGSLGPSLAGYGKIRDYSPEAAKDTYAKIFNSQATYACSNMPRFGLHGFLSEAQIKDVLAYLFDPDSPVNK